METVPRESHVMISSRFRSKRNSASDNRKMSISSFFSLSRLLILDSLSPMGLCFGAARQAFAIDFAVRQQRQGFEALHPERPVRAGMLEANFLQQGADLGFRRMRGEHEDVARFALRVGFPVTVRLPS